MENITSINLWFSKQDNLILHYWKEKKSDKIQKLQLFFCPHVSGDRGEKPTHSYFFLGNLEMAGRLCRLYISRIMNVNSSMTLKKWFSTSSNAH
jgi:hypothetical protein